MSKYKLGLPLEYKKLPEYFDALNVNENTASKNAVIEKILQKYKAQAVLDMTCGTGSQVFYLSARGFKCVGSDFSPALLEIARGKACKENVDIQFIDGDVRNLRVGLFDAVITIDNAIGHLTKSGFTKALRNINRNLKAGGIYIFDILNLDALTDKAVADLSYHIHKKAGKSQIHVTQCSTLDRQSGILTSYDSYMTQKNAGKPETLTSKCSLQLYTALELQEMLKANSFETVAQYGMNGKVFIKDKTLSILTVARKKYVS